MKILKTFELYRSTYFKAANIMNKNQPERGNRLREYGQTKGMYKNFFIPDYKFDIYIGFCLNDDNIDNGEYEVYPKKVIKNIKVEDYLDRWDDDEIAIQFDLDETEHPEWRLSANINLSEKGSSIVIFSDDNKFANRKSVVQFMKLLHKLYLFNDPNTMRKVASKINGSETTELTWRDVSNGNLWGFFQEHGYDWERFKSEININDLWDHYE